MAEITASPEVSTFSPEVSITYEVTTAFVKGVVITTVVRSVVITTVVIDVWLP